MARIPSQVCSEGGVVVRTHVPEINPYPGNSIHPSSKELLWLSSEDRLDSIFFMLWLNAECWWWCQQMLVKTIVEFSSSAATSRASTLWHASVSDKALSELIQMSMVNLLLGILQPWELKHLVKVSPFSVASQPEGGWFLEWTTRGKKSICQSVSIDAWGECFLNVSSIQSLPVMVETHLVKVMMMMMASSR